MSQACMNLFLQAVQSLFAFGLFEGNRSSTADLLKFVRESAQGFTQELVLFEVKQIFAQDCVVDLSSELHLDIFE